MTQSDIQTGDVVIDLTQNAKMVVLEQAAITVEEYSDREGFDLAEYKVHPQLRVSGTEPVFTCAYLKGELAAPGGTYDFPESRLARIPVEDANEDVMRIQDVIRTDLTVALLQCYDELEGEEHRLERAIELVLGEDRAQLVWELVRVDRLGEVES